MKDIQKIIDDTEAQRLKFVNHYNRLSTADKKRLFDDYGKIDDHFNLLIVQINLLLISKDAVRPDCRSQVKLPARTCRVCGCTDNDCRQCIEKTGSSCYWVSSDLCSACIEDENKMWIEANRLYNMKEHSQDGRDLQIEHFRIEKRGK